MQTADSLPFAQTYSERESLSLKGSATNATSAVTSERNLLNEFGLCLYRSTSALSLQDANDADSVEWVLRQPSISVGAGPDGDRPEQPSVSAEGP